MSSKGAVFTLFGVACVAGSMGFANIDRGWGVALIVLGLICLSLGFYYASPRHKIWVIVGVTAFWSKPLADNSYGGEAPWLYQLAIGLIVVTLLTLLMTGPTLLSRLSKRGKHRSPPTSL